jgi:ribosomal protein S18 acetylase RimI-like enzyme
MRSQDVNSVVEIHLRTFKGFFLTFLGRKFLIELYLSILKDTSGISFVSTNNNAIFGFVVGSIEPNGLYRRLLNKSWFRFCLASLLAFIRRPFIFWRLIRAFSMPSQKLTKLSCATLMSIAVDPNCQGYGVGRLLTHSFLKEAGRRGCEYVNLTTDAVNNDSTNQFYHSLGFELFRQYTTQEGRDMNEFLIQLKKRAPFNC